MHTDKDLIVAIFACLAGVFAIVASILNWDYFFNNRKAQFFMAVFGRTGSRIFYSILGVGLIILSVKIWIG